MKSNRRRFMQTIGTSSAGIAMGAAAVATTPESAMAKSQDGQMLLVGDNIAVTNTQYGKVRGYVLRDINYFLGMPYGADTSGANRFMPPQKPKSWSDVYPALWWGNSAPQNMENRYALQIGFVSRSLELRRCQRGLPSHQRLHARHQRREETTGAVLDSRRRVCERQRHRTGWVQRREFRPDGQRRLLLHQSPAGLSRLLQSGRRGRREIRRLRQRRHDGHRRCPRVGSRQHRQLRRRSGQRHHHGTVRRRRQSLHSSPPCLRPRACSTKPSY